ncbi:MAG: hypothetical protein IT381_22245 [Deltaproteobacteria bacterium]|nr:hypothetical protein [Deltaproteobacteria bacterium]
MAIGPGASVAAPASARAFVRERLSACLSAHPAVKTKKPARAKKRKPTALPGPLVRRMVPKGRAIGGNRLSATPIKK